MKRLMWFPVLISFMTFTYCSLGLFSGGLAVSPSPSTSPLNCRFESHAKNVLPFELRLSASECQLVNYYGSNVIVITVKYPSMEVVEPHRRVNDPEKDFSVVFWIVRIDAEGYRENATIAGLAPISIYEGVETYAENGGFKKFTARDGRSVFARNMLNVISVRRLFRRCLLIKYMYSKSFSDVKRMDEFALEFLGKIKID